MAITTHVAPQFGIFTQSRDGFHWCASAPTLEEATAMLDAGDFDNADWAMVLPIAAFRDIDGERDTTIDGDALLLALDPTLAESQL